MGTTDMELAQSHSPPDDKDYSIPKSNGVNGSSGERYGKDETVLARFGKKQQLRVGTFKKGQSVDYKF